MLLAEYLWSEEMIDEMAEAIADVQMPASVEDIGEWQAECACAIVELLVGPRPTETDRDGC